MSGHTGGYVSPPDSFKYIPIQHGQNGEWTVRWTCRQCEKRVQVPRTEEDQDLICPECQHMIPVEANGLERHIAGMPERERHKLFFKIKNMLLWRGWDRKCNCHAAQTVRDVADLLSKNGYESEEYT